MQHQVASSCNALHPSSLSFVHHYETIIFFMVEIGVGPGGCTIAPPHPTMEALPIFEML